MTEFKRTASIDDSPFSAGGTIVRLMLAIRTALE
jgi:hypothetical protein